MADLFNEFKTITGKELPCPKNLSVDEKAVLVHQLRVVRGESMTAIKNFLGISRQQAYNLLKKADEELLSELENQTYTSHFAKTLHELEATRDIHRNRVAKILKIIEDGFIDVETGERREKTGINRDLSEASRIVLAYDKLIIDLKQTVGVIPSNANINPYGSLRDKAPKDIDSIEQELYQKSSDELVSLLLNKLMNRPAHGLLKDIKDEYIL